MTNQNIIDRKDIKVGLGFPLQELLQIVLCSNLYEPNICPKSCACHVTNQSHQISFTIVGT